MLDYLTRPNLEFTPAEDLLPEEHIVAEDKNIYFLRENDILNYDLIYYATDEIDLSTIRFLSSYLDSYADSFSSDYSEKYLAEYDYYLHKKASQAFNLPLFHEYISKISNVEGSG